MDAVIVGGAVGLVVAVVSGLIGAAYGARNDHRPWLRNILREAYTEFSITVLRIELDQRVELIGSKSTTSMNKQLSELEKDLRVMSPEPAARRVEARRELDTTIKDYLTRQTPYVEQIVLGHAALIAVEIAGPQSVYAAAQIWLNQVEGLRSLGGVP